MTQFVIFDGKPTSQKCRVAYAKGIPIIPFALVDSLTPVTLLYTLQVTTTLLNSKQQMLVEEQVTQQQGAYSKALTGSTDLLVVADDKCNSSKVTAARSIGIEIITFDEFVLQYSKVAYTPEVQVEEVTVSSLVLKQKNSRSIQELSELFGVNSQVETGASSFKNITSLVDNPKVEVKLDSSQVKNDGGMFSGLTFDVQLQDKKYEKALVKNGAKIDSKGTPMMLLESTKCKGLTVLWLEACLDKQVKVLETEHFYYKCQDYDTSYLKDAVVAISGYEPLQRDHLKQVVELLGGQVTAEFSKKNTHLLTSQKGFKHQKAQEWKIPIISEAYLSKSIKTGILIQSAFQHQPKRLISFAEEITLAADEVHAEPKKLLDGCYIVAKAHHEEVQLLCSQLGAVYQKVQNKLTTHVIQSKGEDGVSVHWLHACRDQNKKLPDEQFPPSYNPRYTLPQASTELVKVPHKQLDQELHSQENQLKQLLQSVKPEQSSQEVQIDELQIKSPVQVTPKQIRKRVLEDSHNVMYHDEDGQLLQREYLKRLKN